MRADEGPSEEEIRKEKERKEERAVVLWYLNNMEECAESNLFMDKLFLWFNDSTGATAEGATLAYVVPAPPQAPPPPWRSETSLRLDPNRSIPPTIALVARTQCHVRRILQFIYLASLMTMAYSTRESLNWFGQHNPLCRSERLGHCTACCVCCRVA